MYDVELWDNSSLSNIAILERLQKKILRNVIHMLCYVNNSLIYKLTIFDQIYWKEKLKICYKVQRMTNIGNEIVKLNQRFYATELAQWFRFKNKHRINYVLNSIF